MDFPKNPIALVAIALAAGLAFYSAYIILSTPGPATYQVPTRFTANGETYVFNYTATTQAERESGLMNKKVTNSTTMLFAFSSPGLWQFWMYGTNTSLDVIWVNSTGTSGVVVSLVSSAPPCSDKSSCLLYSPTSPALFAIEAKGGFATSHGIEVGTAIQFS